MEAAPPSYQTATVKDPWHVVAPYLDRYDLLTASRVCRKWHGIFTPHLWGNPALHFQHATFDLNAFLDSLTQSRTTVTSCTHTICLPPSQAYDDSYHSSWLHTLLHRLPQLQSLIIRSQASFDHGALLAITAAPEPSAAPQGSLGLALRLLDASYCWNAGPSGLADALGRLQQLLYLDLSGVSAAKDHRVLSQIFHINGLKVLKLRSVSLTDLDMKRLAANVQTRVKSLDLRHNRLTDASAQILVDSCYSIGLRSEEPVPDGAHALHTMGPEMLRVFQGNEFEAHLRYSLTSGFAPRFIFEGVPDSGVTHLYLADNHLSPSGFSILIAKPQLHVLDIGQQSTSYHAPDWSHLIETIHQSPSTSLTALRVDHSFITSPPPPDDAPHLSSSNLDRQSRLALISHTTYHPLLLPRLRLLTLTSIPSLSPSLTVYNSLLHLLHSMAQEAHLSLLIATQDWSRPPGALHAAAKSLFAMDTLVLEVCETGGAAAASDHPDTEDLWRNARGDFTFFDGEAADNVPSSKWVDNVARLAELRRKARSRWEARDPGEYVEGYWDGVVKVRRDVDEEYTVETEDYISSRRSRNTFG